jgi:glycosyltransferase involved in cell wall biosynthesis
LLCNSQTVQKRIYNIFHRHATIINPGIDTVFFTPSVSKPKNYFLVVSRLVAHKKIDLAIHACGQLGYPLKIVGSGRDLSYLKLISKQYKNIDFLGTVSNSQLKSLYQYSQALICPQVEDFGLSPLESLACGRPIIAYNSGGITETITLNTGIFFDFQTVESLKNAIIKFLNSKFFPNNCRQQSLKFSKTLFMLNFKNQVDTLWRKHQTTIL